MYTLSIISRENGNIARCEYETVDELSEKMNISLEIARLLHGSSRFRRKFNCMKDSDVEVKRRGIRGRAIVCVETLDRFDSIRHLSTEIQVSDKTISTAIHREGYFKHGDFTYKREESLNLKGKPTRIYCMETGVEYPNLSIASDELGYARETILEYAKTGDMTAEGLHYRISGYGKRVSEKKEMRVRCINSYSIYDSISDLSKEIGYTVKKLYQIIPSGQPIDGKYYEFIK